MNFKKKMAILTIVLLTTCSIFVAKAQTGCGCLDDCDTFCMSDPNFNCIITYVSGEKLTCPSKRPIPE